MRGTCFVLFLCVVVSGGVVGAESAAALKCRRPTNVSLLYPGQNQVAPRNAMIYLARYHWGGAFDPKLLVLKDAATRRAVPSRVLSVRSSGLVRLKPKRALGASRKYVVYYRGKPVGLFRTSRSLARVAVPTVGRPLKVRFGPPRRSPWTGAGRRGWLELPRVVASRRPVVLQIDYGANKWRRSVGLVYQRKVTFANTGKCSRLGKMPVRGSYSVAVTPWSATGRPGKKRALAGAIR